MTTFIFGLAVLGTVTSTVFMGFVLVAAIQFKAMARRSPRLKRSAARLPVSLLKPLHGAEPRLCEYLESFFALDYPEFEIIFCARTEDDAGLQLARQVAAAYPEIPVRFLTSGEPPWPNARCYSLSVMASKARHELMVVTDSDVLVRPHFLRDVATEFLRDPAVGGLTCLYRGNAEGLGFWALLEGLGMSIEMSAGVIVADMLEGMRFMLGPCMAVRKQALKYIGGFEKLGYYYADDFMLGNLLAKNHRVVLSDHIIDHCIVNNSFTSNFSHQWSWMKSTRFSRPLGHLGMGLTFAMPFGILGLLGGCLAGRPYSGLALFLWAYLSRVLLCLLAGGWVVQDPDSLRFCWVYPLRDLMGAVLWAASYLSRRVGWRDNRFILEKHGLMRKTNA
jgi:ceramide glucosyltransferase